MPTSHFNGLTEAESERLEILSEECAEVIQAICKIKRHGYRSTDPTLPMSRRKTNLFTLESEIADMLIAVDRLALEDDLSSERIRTRRAERLLKPFYLHHQTNRELPPCE